MEERLEVTESPIRASLFRPIRSADQGFMWAQERELLNGVLVIQIVELQSQNRTRKMLAHSAFMGPNSTLLLIF